MKQIFAFIIVMLVAVAPASAQCLSDAQARAAVASGKARSLGSVASAAGGQIIRAQLCKQGNRYVYRLSVKEYGRVVTKTVNASR